MDTLIKLAETRLHDVVADAGLTEGSVASIRRIDDASAALHWLIRAGALVDAVKLLAHCLPKRESIWWACTCCRSLTDGADLGEDEAPVALAEQWVYKPKDTTARAAYVEAERRGFQTPGGWAGVAAFWSSSSLAPPGQVKVAPAHYLTGVAVAGAVLLAATVEPVTEIDARYMQFLKFGLDIAAGGTARSEDGQLI